MQIHQTLFRCDKCPNFFDTKPLMEQHQKNAHYQSKLQICNFCNIKFQDESELKEHLRKKHIRKCFQCTICLQNFKHKYELFYHRIKQHGCKYCYLCQKTLQQNVSINGHIFKCKIVDKSNRSSSGTNENTINFDFFSKFFATPNQKQNSRKSSIDSSFSNLTQDSCDLYQQELFEYIDDHLTNKQDDSPRNEKQEIDTRTLQMEDLQKTSLQDDQQKLTHIEPQNLFCGDAQIKKFIKSKKIEKYENFNIMNIFGQQKRYKYKDKKKMKPIQFDDILVEIINIRKRINQKNNIFHIKREDTVFYLNGQIKNRKSSLPFILEKFTYVKVQTDSKYNFQFDRIKILQNQEHLSQNQSQIQNTNKTPYICLLCKKNFFSYEGLQQHSILHSKM